MASHVVVWLHEVWQHWLTVVMGAGVSLVIFLWEHFRKEAIKWRPILLIFVLGLLAALFLAWQDEYTSAEWRGSDISNLEGQLATATANASPKLEGEVSQIASGNWHGHAVFVIDITLFNRAGAPSGASNWAVSVQLDDSSIVNGVVMPPFATDITRQMPAVSGVVLNLKASEYLPRVTAQAIGSGGSATGWILVTVPSIQSVDYLYDHKGTLLIRFSDIATNQPHLIKHELGQKGFQNPGSDNGRH